jgi:hypothetical protein
VNCCCLDMKDVLTFPPLTDIELGFGADAYHSGELKELLEKAMLS